MLRHKIKKLSTYMLCKEVYACVGGSKKLTGRAGMEDLCVELLDILVGSQ